MSEKIYLDQNKKYTYGKGYIAMPIEIGGLPNVVSIEGEKLMLKSSFHISLLCVDDVVEQFNVEEESIVKIFSEFAKDNKIELLVYTGEFRFAEVNERKTLVALCEVSNLKQFFDVLNRELNIEVPVQPAHATVYTLQPDAGIGLNSAKMMENLSKLVEVPEAVKVVFSNTK